MVYEVKLDIFEGPLDLLLHLIEKNEVSIGDIPIAAITDQYLQTIEIMRSFNLELAGEYLVMASYLTYLKSQTLLPVAVSDDGTPGDDVEDPRAELVAHLLEYRRYRTVAAELGSMPLFGREVFERDGREPLLDGQGRSVVSIDINELVSALQALLEKREPKMSMEIRSEPISIQIKIEEIITRLKTHRWLSFGSLFSEDFSRGNIVVTLLALLEVVKNGVARMYQDIPFGSIVISRR